MIQALKEIDRSAGYFPIKDASGVTADANKIVSGRVVTIAIDATSTDQTYNSTVVVPVLGTSTSAFIYGIAADDTAMPINNGMSEQIDNYAKNGEIAAYLFGGIFKVWNDGRGAVFASSGDGSVISAAIGTPLYVDDNGLYSKTQGTAAAGKVVVGYVIEAPTASDADNGTLTFKAAL